MEKLIVFIKTAQNHIYLDFYFVKKKKKKLYYNFFFFNKYGDVRYVLNVPSLSSYFINLCNQATYICSVNMK